MTTALALPKTRITKAKKTAITQSRASGNVARRATLPEYLEPGEIGVLIQVAPSPVARLLILTQWRAGLRISEALALTPADLDLEVNRPALRVRSGKGGKSRLVPVHPELAAAFRNVLAFGKVGTGSLFGVSRSTAWRWIQTAISRAEELNQLPAGRHVGTHTLRHSAARHWLASGVPINVVSRWLGHASIQTTLIYLEILPDPTGWMDRIE